MIGLHISGGYRMTVPYITIEGPIGIGKTSLARAVRTHYSFHLLEEIVYENPFLEQFYQNIEEWSFQTEMFFLCNRYKQLNDSAELYLKKGTPLVSDYNIFKNTIFARRTLKPEQLDKYLRIYDILTENMPKPTLIIHLTASLETLQKRIQLRGRHFETTMDPTYLENLIMDYRQFIAALKRDEAKTQIIEIECDDLDFVHNEQDFIKIIELIDSHLKGVRKHA
jgi:deoxyguanosine kinase